MMKHEFDSRVKKSTTQEQYDIIEEVYLHHPAITDKDEIADLYNKFGMAIILDMHPRALQAMEIERRIAAKRAEINEAQRELEELLTEQKQLAFGI